MTGTNGKTTTTALTALLVERAGKRVVAAGNIGPTLLDTLAQSLDAAAAAEPTPLPEVWVMELSSFQLDGVDGFEPDAATVLNLTQDHLDWHGTMDAYAAAKARIFGRHALMVINRDDARVRAMVPQPPAADAARKAKAPKFQPRRVCEFGLGAPTQPGDFGLVEQHGMAWLVRALPLEEGVKLRKGEAPDIHLQQLMPADALRIRGRHNAANALAALALATAIGLPLAPMLHALRDYRGEPHRVEPVAVVGGVEAFDDSKGTNVGATVAALEGLGAECAPGKLVLILGGDGKGQDFAPLAAPVQRFARAVALIGRDAGAARSRAGRLRRAAAAPRQPARRHRLVLRAGPGRRCGAAVAGLRQPGHVPQLRPPRRGLRRGGARAGRRTRRGGGMTAERTPRLVEPSGASPGPGRKAADALPVRDQVQITPQRNTSLAGFDRPLVLVADRRCWRWAW